MSKKYKLGQKHPIENLHRIVALRDGPWGPSETIGGWIESEKNLSHDGDCWIYNNAQVSGNTKVFGSACVFVNAKVFDNATIHGKAKVYGNALVSGNAKVSGNATIHGKAKVCGNAIFNGDEIVGENSLIDKNPVNTDSRKEKAKKIINIEEILIDLMI